MQNILDTVEPYVLSSAVIDLDKMSRNYHKVQSELSSGAVVAGIVKANSYGFGAVPVSKRLYKEGCRHFFVATVEEGLEIRRVLNNDAQIFLLAGIMKGSEQICLENSLTPVLNDMNEIDLWIDFSKKIGEKLTAAIQVDTGMVRNGLSQKDIEKYHTKITDNINIAFVMSHLACADLVGHYKNIDQLNRFKEMLSFFGNNVKASFSATNGIFLGKEYQFDIVRPGKALYGFSVREDKIDTFEPVMDIYTRIIQLNTISKGETIGYGATFVAERDMKTVTLGMGYADGFMRKFGGFGHAFIKGKRVPIVGRISMDYMVADVTDFEEVSELQIGEWVALTQSPDYTLEKWALQMNTLPHEVACRLGRRVKKIYIDTK
ncbi:MAG: alanine racemase [Alphaproteobacteria bacterium]|nr:alanine racemase [Alphaproteobacteria bacterium]